MNQSTMASVAGHYFPSPTTPLFSIEHVGLCRITSGFKTPQSDITDCLFICVIVEVKIVPNRCWISHYLISQPMRSLATLILTHGQQAARAFVGGYDCGDSRLQWRQSAWQHHTQHIHQDASHSRDSGRWTQGLYVNSVCSSSLWAKSEQKKVMDYIRKAKYMERSKVYGIDIDRQGLKIQDIETSSRKFRSSSNRIYLYKSWEFFDKTIDGATMR